MYSITILEARSLNSWCRQGYVPSEVSREETFLASPSLCWSCRSLACHNSSLCLHLHLAFFPMSLWLCILNFSLFSLIRTPVIGFRAHPNSGWCHTKILNLTRSAKTLFPKQYTFTVPGFRTLGGSQFNPLLRVWWF